MGAESRVAAHVDPLSRSREWWTLVLISLGPFYSVQDPGYGLVPYTFRVGPPISVNLF